MTAVAVACALLSAAGCAGSQRSDVSHPPATDQALALNDRAASMLPDRPGEARKLLEEAQRLYPNLPAVLNNLGICHLFDGQYYEAAVAFRRAAAIEPLNPEPLYNLGLTFEKAHNWEMSALYYERALQLDPQSLEATENLARAYAKLGRSRSEIAPLAAMALERETRSEWVAWLSRYAEFGRGTSDDAPPQPEGEAGPDEDPRVSEKAVRE